MYLKVSRPELPSIALFHQNGKDRYADCVLISVHRCDISPTNAKIRKHLVSTNYMQSRYYYSQFADEKIETQMD